MIGKLISYGATREAGHQPQCALRLSEMVVEGISTNIRCIAR